MVNVLIVEDDRALRSQIRFALEEHYNVFEAGDRQAAMECLEKEDIGVVILDLGLPPHENAPDEGIKLLQHILENLTAKVIILTGQTTAGIAMEAIKGGAFDYILKPVNMEKILFSIERAILFRDAEEKLEKRGVKKISFNVEVGQGLQPAREEAEKNVVLKVLRDTNFNVYKTAKLLNVKRESIYYFMKKFGFKREEDDGND
ncbi:MAG: KDP operon transcriptional regulatory protein KdpE [Syntrophorhabdus sp. PtaU1.Bin058]|nr:MAG: KDP operon transcriptional regulatory protein KdpE [Syntrophorhabdus sp. PtaU1.Bin058]